MVWIDDGNLRLSLLNWGWDGWGAGLDDVFVGDGGRVGVLRILGEG